MNLVINNSNNKLSSNYKKEKLLLSASNPMQVANSIDVNPCCNQLIVHLYVHIPG